MAPGQDRIDMGSLSQKELLILLNERVARIDSRLTTYEKDNLELRLKVNELETKMKLWAAVIALISSGVVSLLLELFKN